MNVARSLSVLALLTLVSVVPKPLVADETPTADTPLVAEAVRQAMQDRDYPAAIKAIDAALGQEDAPRDYLTYLKGQALHLQGNHDAAIAVFDSIEKQFPDSPWQRRARFAKAVALARKGDFRGAELIYRAEAEYLLSADRKQELADVYLEFADAYFDPPEEDEEPNYHMAQQFYQKALEMGPKPQKRIEVELLVAQCSQERKEYDEAAKRFEQFIEDHPDSPRVIEARFRLGECRLAEDEFQAARRVWEDLLAAHADSDSPRIAEATFMLSRTWRVLDPFSLDERELGIATLKNFLEKYPDHERAPEAYLDIAAAYISDCGRILKRAPHTDTTPTYAAGHSEEAVTTLKEFLADKRYADAEEIPEARKRLGDYYKLQKKYTEALATWREYLTAHPTHPAWSEVQRQIIETEYLMAREEYEAKHYDAARRLFGEFLAKYPLDRRGPEILYLFGRMHAQQEQWDEAIAAWRRLVSKYPDSNEASKAQFAIAEVLETKLGKLEEALEEYRKVDWGSAAGDAREAIARLTALRMTVATDRVFRSDEVPRLRLVTRNIESVTVRAYRIDLETYFRKMHLATGVEKLDIALIDPDHSFEFEVPDYAEYKELENAIEIPLPEGDRAGVMAVTVASETLEATTLLVQSDLDLIVKSSRDEVFVFAENMLTGKPWPNARLLISNGKQVFAEGTTGDDGVFQQTYDELKEAGDVRVFAVAGGNTASNVVGLSGVGVAQGLTDKGYLYTDRPVYRASQWVHVRGCVRRVADDTYTIEEGKKYDLSVLDPRNRIVWQEEIALGPFGSFHARVPLPATSPQGDYRIMAADRDGKSFQGTFQVHEYKLEPVCLEVDTPRKVYYRGETIEGTIRAAYDYGAPLADREIRYQLEDGRSHTARTDEKGEVRFSLPTRRFNEDQVLELTVELPERNLSQSVNFVLATRGFRIGVDTVRDVYVAGETFEVTVDTVDAQGEPVGRQLELKVIEKTTVDGEVGERLVETHAIETTADGQTRKTIKIEQGGDYELRVEGTDRFGNTISGWETVRISGDEDKTRLLILADEHSYKVGDTATVTLHWREEPALALVTFQGARVLDYRLVELKTGANKLTIPMAARLAPNFELAVAVMTDPRAEKLADKEKVEADEPPRRFHTASSPFSVERELRVQLVTKRQAEGEGPIRPGEEVEVTVTTTDPQGKPVAAELSLAMIRKSLLDRFPSTMPAIGEFFRGQPRKTAVRTDSSITFQYEPSTQPINTRLLTEAERLAVAEREAASMSMGMGMGGLGGGFAMESFDGPASPQGGLYVEQYDPDDPFAGNHDTSAARNGDDPFGSASADYDRAFEDDQSVDGAFAKAFENERRVIAQVAHPQSQAWMEVLTVGGDRPDAPAFAFLRDETAYWNPAVVTGPDGSATVTLTMPEQSTAWKLLAKGITTETLAGEATEEVVASKELFGELKLPTALTDGDEVELIASIHNGAVEKGKIDVVLKTTIGDRTVEQKKTLDVTGKGIHELSFKAAINRPEEMADETAGAMPPKIDAVFELSVTSGTQRDMVRRAVPLLPYGVPVFATAGGSATADQTVWIEPPKEMAIDVPGLEVPVGPDGQKVRVEPLEKTSFQQPSLQILIGPTVEQSLLDVVFGRPPLCQIEAGRSAAALEWTTSDLMASLALADLLGATREAGGPQAAALDLRTRAAIGSLVSAQNDDGGWSWTGRGGDSQPGSTARAVWAIGLARAAGYEVPEKTFNNAIQYVRDQMVATANTDYETKALLLHALAVNGRGEFAVANRLHRDRQLLSSGALAYLALALIEMDRTAIAGEVLDVLAARDLDTALPLGRGTAPWSDSPAELRALYALAQLQIDAKAAAAKPLVEWLMDHRRGNRWSPEKATGPATMALCRWFGQSRFEGERYKLAVFVNDIRAALLDVEPAAGTQSVDVPAKLLRPGRQRINFQITGRGRYTYQCILGGFVPAEKLTSTYDGWQIERTYEPAQIEVDGRPVARGFKVARGEFEAFRNPLTQLPVGRRGLVELKIKRQNLASDTPPQNLEYLVVTEPIPAGATVIERTITGPFERYEISPGAITFYVGNRRFIGEIRYELYGYLPGTYRVAPTVIRNAHRPEQLVVAKPVSLSVLPQGANSADPYRLSPQELYELGKHHFDKGEYKAAAGHLRKLVNGWNLYPNIYKSSVQMLLDSHLEIGPAAEIVRYFEIVKEKWPDVEVPFGKITAVGTAYHEMGEYERSYLVFRALVEGRFRKESGVAGFLQSQGEFLRSVEVLGQLLREYPPESYIASSTYALAQTVYAKAPGAAGDPKLKEAEVNRIDLIRRAWRMLEAFLTAYPEDPAADRGAFAAANALLELEDYAGAAAACNRYAARYPKSDLLDTYWYIIGYSRFATSEHQAALDMCRKVAEHKRTDPRSGREVESTNKWRAIYILGQVHHSLGEAAEAVREYRRVEDRFPDAQKSIDYFMRKAIALPEVSTIKPGDPAEVELTFRNVAACDVKVYRIDLMKFGLLGGSLGGISRINLAGIRPYHEETVKLGDGLDYGDRTRKIALPLKEEGAYLVVGRGDNMHTSGLVLLSPLGVEVQEDVASGQVRATVKDRVAEKYLRDVEVRVIGSGNDEVVAGQTDLRGVFTADGVYGKATVIARSDGSRYAFYRGQQILQPGQYLVDQGISKMDFDDAKEMGVTLAGDSATERRINQALDSPTHFEFVETPLSDVANYFRQRHRIEIQLDQRALEDVGIATDTPITRRLQGVSLRAALKLILRDLDLTTTIQDEVLLITTPEEAENRLVTKAYPVGDLIRYRDESGKTWADFDSLIDMITSTVEPTTWDDVGGPGSISPTSFNNSEVIVLSQTDEVHREISQLLQKLRSLSPRDENGELPVRERQQPGMQYGGFGGMGGGFGGGFGGDMGGFGGSFGGGGGASPAAGADLLKGLQDANLDFQSEQVDQLQDMYESGQGMGGMGAGGLF